MLIHACIHYVLGVSGVFLLYSWLGTLYLIRVPYYCVVAFPGVRAFGWVFLYQHHGELSYFAPVSVMAEY